MSTHSLKAQWGDPPKSNMWKVEHSVDHIGKKWTVTSPAMAGAVILLNSKSASPEWWVNYYNEEKYGFPPHSHLYRYFAHERGEMTDGECVEHFLSERFYREVLKKKIGEGVVELKVPKVASSKKLELQWGSPPKPNIWSSELIKGKKALYMLNHWLIRSPLMKGFILVFLPVTAGGEVFVAYNKREWTPSLMRTPAYRDIDVLYRGVDANLSYVQSQAFWEEKVVPRLKSDELRGKVASSNLEAQWGDPVKSNLWKVEYDKAFTQYTIKSPVLEGHFVVKMYPPSSAEIKFFDATRGVTWARYLSPVTIEDILSRQFYLESIKPAIYLTHEVRLKKGLKVASSEIKLQWGDPPKPNVWKVKERPGRGVKHRGYIFDISTPLDPELGITIHQSPSMGARKAYRTTVFYGSSCLIENAAGFLVSEGAHPADIFSTQYFWDRIKDEIRDKTPTSMKVASSNLKAQWGDPPKPNMWKVETLQRSKMVALTRVTSPVLQGSIWLGVYGVVFYCPHDKMLSPLTEEKMVEFENNITVGDQVGITKIMGINPKRLFLSNKFYLEHLAPKIADGIIRLNGNVKVASGEALKAMWGDPPKPNVWSVEEVRYGWEPMYRVFSPLMEGEVWLSDSLLVYYFPKGLGLPQRKLGPDCDLRSIKLVDSNYPLQRLKSAKSKEHFLSQAFWLEHLKSNLNLKTSKLAFKRGK